MTQNAYEGSEVPSSGETKTFKPFKPANSLNSLNSEEGPVIVIFSENDRFHFIFTFHMKSFSFAEWSRIYSRCLWRLGHERPAAAENPQTNMTENPVQSCGCKVHKSC